MAATGSLYFGSPDQPLYDDTRYYSGPALSLANADWTLLLLGVRIDHFCLADPLATTSTLMYPIRNTSFGGGTGGNDFYIRFWPAHHGTTGDRRKAEFRMAVGGVNVGAGAMKGTTQFDRHKTYNFMVVRTGTEVNFYSCENGGSAVQEHSDVYNASFGARTLPAMNIGIGAWGNTIQGVAHITAALSTADFEAICNGDDIDTVVTSGGGTRGWRAELSSPAATISPAWGSGDLTRQGTWTNRPTQAPTLPTTGATGITVTTWPRAHQPIALVPGTTTGSLTLSGAYAGFTPATFQARVINWSDGTEALTWTSLSSFSAAAGAWSGTLAGIPAGGPYLIQIRDSVATSTQWLGGLPVWCCPVAATIGQSPFTFVQESYKGTETLTGTLIEAVTTVGSGGGVELWRMASASCPAGLAHIANQFNTDASKPLFLIPAAVGGTSSGNWATDNAGIYTALLNRIDVAGSPSHTIIYWNNGASETVNAATIKANHDTIYGNLEDDIETARSLTFDYIMVPYNRDTGLVGGNATTIRIAQTEWAEDHADFGTKVFLGPSWTDMQTDAEATGTAQAGAASTITLAANDPCPTSNGYDGIRIVSGTGSGQTATLTAFNTGTKVATRSGTWSTNPDNTSVYEVWGDSPHPNAVGVERIGARLGRDIAYRHSLTANRAAGPTISAAYRVNGGDGSVIFVHFTHISGTALRTVTGGTTATAIIGFEVSDDNFSTTETITTAEIISANVVKLTLSGAPGTPAGLEVRFLYGAPLDEDRFDELGDMLYDNSGLGDQGGAPAQFTTDDIPVTEDDALTPLTPADLATDQAATPTLTWSGGTANYTVQVNEEALGEVVWADPTYEATGIATTSHAVTTTLPPGLYYWRVVDANGVESEVWEFTITAATDGHSRTGMTLGLGLGL